MKRLGLTLIYLLILSGCSSAYYGTMEKLGIEKRDIMIDRVEDARDAQGDASEQFTSALEQFRATVAFDGGDLEDVYDDLNTEYERSLSRADVVSERIEEVADVAEDLFEEWTEELDEYSRADMRRQSQAMMQETRQRYEQMMRAMRRAEGTMEPVLESFQDQVLFLKHNLNARAIGSLRNELDTIERDTERLVQEMNKAINEADAFIQTMQ